MSDNIIKSFGTILKDNRYVRAMSTKYKQVKKKYPKDETLPSKLNPIVQWSNLLQSIKNQGACGCCWAMSTSGALGDRLTIMTLGQFAVELSPYQMIMCQGAIIPDKDKESESDYKEYIKEVNQLLNSICSILPIANTGKKETLNYEDIENNWEQLALLFFNGAIDVETRQITDIISSKVCELHFFPYRKWFQEKAAELYPQPENETTQD
jgi:hypothetical protein